MKIYYVLCDVFVFARSVFEISFEIYSIWSLFESGGGEEFRLCTKVVVMLLKS
jgi:hypothetical protein